MFHDVPARPNYIELENKVLRLWAETQAFEKLREQTRGGVTWSFLDGPITANNPLGVHHGWGRTYKDVFNRYNAMLGHELRWQQGFDCQGLWVEVEVEKELDFKSKREIEAYGVANFVNKCKERVYRYAAVQTEQSKRLGYWMDWENSYYTLSDENNYGIWHFLKHAYERGRLYRGHDVMPWCPRCGTALSEHEIATEGYAEKTHLTLTVAFPLLDRPGEALLAWTTTPWTLPANVAAAVHPDLVYVRVALTSDERRGVLHTPSDEQTTSFWLVKGAFANLQSPISNLDLAVVEERPGGDLVGWRYSGPFDELKAQQGVAHRVVAWDDVSETEGTGVVHIAPGAGKEDFALGQTLGLSVLAPLDDDGVYVAGYGGLTGRKAGEVAETVEEELERKGLLFHRELYTHRYPICWRCGTELVFRLVDEWLVRMDQLREPMMNAARSATWLPSFGLDRELDWLRNMGDWMISKKRYWGLALPIYPCDVCGHVTVIGSKEELRERAVAGWEAFEGHSPHRPWVDEVRVACPHCGASVARVPDVGNPWLDAGIVAFSTLGYHTDRAYWEQWFPADLVLESFPDQFRNWFYALLAMSTALENRAPFKTLLGYATMKDEHGEEMHKSKGNSIPFEQAADWLGVEPLRWLFASTALDRNLHFGRHLVEETARRLQPLWEVYRFFVTYARLDEWRLEIEDWRLEARQSLISNLQSSLDLWLVARLNQLVTTARERLDAYDARGFAQEVEAFLDDLSNWYVRRSRRRFWSSARGVANADKNAAYTTLHLTLVTLARLLAPVLPFLSEALYQNLVRSIDQDAPVSVHLTGYPQASYQLSAGSHQSSAFDRQLLRDMALVRRVVGLGRVARKHAGVRVRQPLARMLVAAPKAEDRAALLQHQDELLDELNVKALDLLDSSTELLRYRVKPNLRLLGPRLGKTLPALRAALEALDDQAAADVARTVATGQSFVLLVGEEQVTLAPEEVLVETTPLEGYAVVQEFELQVALDTMLTDELQHEGLARDLVRAVQEARKNAGLVLTHRIDLYVDVHTILQQDSEIRGQGSGTLEHDNARREQQTKSTALPTAVSRTLAEWSEYVRNETLAVRLLRCQPPPEAHVETVDFGEEQVMLGIRAVARDAG
jgi:isoleucyl-tRNA synthetase